MRLEESIRAQAYRLGFALCGFARIDPPPHAEFVQRWLAAGNAAGMSYIARGMPKRLEPRLILPPACSVVTVGYRYTPPALPVLDWRAEMRGRIAAYAFGDDYHEVVGEQLRKLARAIGELRPGTLARAYVDTGPVLEREWAACGGIGWFGKNTNILHMHEGSWFFLGEILTNLELEPDPVLADRCGRCTRCLDRCPTAALKPGYVLDARLCISYLTIEHCGAIPVELRAQVGNWIFGCDVCQEVCPWNERRARRQGGPPTATLLPYLPELLRLTPGEFRQRFRRTALWRAKREGLARNAAVALGNSGNPAAVEALADSLGTDPAPVVRVHAAWALGRIGDPAGRRALKAAWRGESNPTVRDEIDAALTCGGVPR